MACKIGNGLKETIQVLIGSLLLVFVGVPIGVSIFWIIGWVQLHLFEIGLIVDASNEFEYYIGSGFAFTLSVIGIWIAIILLIKFIYLVFAQPRRIINWFVECDDES